MKQDFLPDGNLGPRADGVGAEPLRYTPLSSSARAFCLYLPRRLQYRPAGDPFLVSLKAGPYTLPTPPAVAIFIAVRRSSFLHVTPGEGALRDPFPGSLSPSFR